MPCRTTHFVMGSLLALALSHVAIADADQREDRLRPNFTFDKHSDYGHRGRYFNRINTLPNYINNVDASAETVSEIVAASKDGKTLVYTDGVREAIGFIDIANPYLAVHAGTFDLSGEPTSVAVLGNRWALVGVNTSESFTDPSGHLAVIDIHSRMLRATIELGGQPDSVSISPDGKFAAVAIENERDEDIEVDGVEGGLPQAPAGYLAIVDLDHDDPAAWGGARFVDLTGLAAYAPEDPEPEFVDINAANQAVVTMQENNHIAIVDLASGTVVEHFTAGSVDLDKIDAAEDDVIELTDALANVPREPDAVTWIPGKHGRELIATANEGDLFGGSRGFSVFDRDGSVLYDAGADFEQLAVRHGHYPEARSENKGAEPEAIEYARFGGQDYLFVGSERGSFVAVYTLDRTGRPTFSQLLPAPLGPEGLLAIPSRNLLIVSGETDDPSFGVRSSVMIYRLGGGKADYPQILSANDENGLPIAWSALLGMTAVAGKRGRLLGVWDSYYSQSRIFQIDASRHPAVITGALTLQGGSAAYDPEGIAIAPDGSYWIASEGNASDSRPNLLVHADEQGTVIEEIGLPAEIMACRALPGNSGSLGSGFEGVSVARTSWRSYALLVAQQRGWNYGDPGCDSLDDDPLDLDTAEPAQTRIWSYDPEIGEWDHVAYELEPLPEKASWVGLSEITQVPGGFIVIERDNRTGDFADLKTLVFFSHRAMRDGIVSRSEKRVYDMMPDMLATRGWITDKPEGVAVTWDGQVYVVTDNDGVDDWSGETSFLRLGRWWQLFR